MLSARIQVQAIADALQGLIDEKVPLRAFDEPFKTIYKAVRDAEQATRHQVLFDVVAQRKDKETIIAMITNAEPGFSLTFPSLAEIAPDLPPIEWLWPDWIPMGMITLFGASPGAGKSYVALDIARRISSGMQWPDDQPNGFDGRNVIYVDAEVVPQMINDRANRWEMDTEKLYLMLPKGKLYIDFSDPGDRDHLADMAYQLNPALIVIDSLSSISVKGENNIEDVRGILSFLNQLALDNVCGLVLVHHLRKRGGMALQPDMDLLTIDDFRGSGHIIAMARSVMGLSVVQTGPSPDKNGPRRLEIVKTNLVRYPESLGVTFQPMHPTGVMLVYGDQPERYKAPRKLDHCKEWLVKVLKDGPMRFKEIKELGAEEDYSRATLCRAKKELGGTIVNTKGHRDPNNEWELVE